MPESERLSLTIGLPLRNQAALAKLLHDLYDPASQRYHRYLTPAQFADQFGPTAADYDAVLTFAKQHGLIVTGTHRNRVLLDVNGAVPDIEKAFHLTLRLYQHPTEARRFHAPDAEPSFDLAVPVLSIGGLDDYVLPHPMNFRSAGQNQTVHAAAYTGSAPGGNFWGNDFRAAYVPGVSLTGAGQAVDLMEFDGYYASDIMSYETQAGLPGVPLTNVLLDGFSGTPGGNDDEVSLDIEMAVSMAPGLSQIIVYEGENTDDILNRMALDNAAKQISASWTYPVDATSDQIFQEFAAQGQSFFNASGDSDAYTGSLPTPTADTNITIVGGTSLTTSGGPGGSWVSETVWNWGYDAVAGEDVGSSGGISAFPIPPWQAGINMQTNQGSATLRNIPDVAFTADNVWVVYGNGQSGEFGGTSCAAPLWAAFMALVNQQAAAYADPPAGFINPAIYAIGRSSAYANCFHDIATGNNTNNASPNLYYACPGYDLCTGWGTPTSGLINALAPTLLEITPASGFSATGYVGGPFKVNDVVFALTNNGSASLSWALANTASWLTVSSVGGALAPGGPAAMVTAALNGSATNLPPGNYAGTVWFTNLSTGGVAGRQFTLQVQARPDPLVISPATGFSDASYMGGVFNFTSETLTLTNIGAGVLNWSLANTSSWLTVSSTGGTLAPGGPATVVTAGLNPSATNLPVGAYATSLSFLDLADSVMQTRQFTLQILLLLQNAGFEDGSFSNWTQSGDIYYTSVSTDSAYVHSGHYGARLGPAGSLGYISQTLPASPAQLYLLSLWLDSPDGETPNEFQVQWNGTTLFDELNISAIGWTNLQFVVAGGVGGSVLEFGFRDDPSYLGLDQISVQAISAPQLQSVTRSGGITLLEWPALPGLTYQIQYKTNLLQPNWLNLGGPIQATNSAASVSDVNPDRQRFYRVGLLP